MLKRFSMENYGVYGNKLVLDLTNVREDIDRHPEMIKDGIVNKGFFFDNKVLTQSPFGQGLFDIVGRLTDDQTTMHRVLQEYDDENINFEYLFCFDGIDVEFKYTRTGFLLIKEILTIDGQEIINTETGGAYNEYLKVPNEELTKGISWVKTIGQFVDPELNEINAAYAKLLSFAHRMLYIDNLDLINYVGMTKGFQDVVGYFCENNRHKKLMQFLEALGMDYNLEVREDKGIRILWDKKAGLFSETVSSGTLRLMSLFYWLLKIKESGGCKFFYINGFDCFLHHLVSKELFDMLKEMDCQVMVNFMTNTSLVSNYRSRPDTCFILHDDKIVSLDEITDYKLRNAHDVEKVFRRLFLK